MRLDDGREYVQVKCQRTEYNAIMAKIIKGPNDDKDFASIDSKSKNHIVFAVGMNIQYNLFCENDGNFIGVHVPDEMKEAGSKRYAFSQVKCLKLDKQEVEKYLKAFGVSDKN